jgi:uncharacterized membrane protein
MNTGRYTCAVQKRLHDPLIIPVFATLLGWGLRIAALDARALWFDEGVSLTFSQMSLPDVLKYSILWQDTNPPLYRILLGIWTDGTGVTVWTARVFSALLGVLAIPLTYRLARRLDVPPAASVIATLIIAVAPMQIYYSREVKHYAFIQFCLLVGIWLWLRVFKRRSRSRSDMPILLSIATLTTFFAFGAHYMAALMPLTLGLWTLAWAAIRRRRGETWHNVLVPVLLWGVAQLAAALLLLPWIIATAQGAAAGTQSASVNVGLSALPPVSYLMQMGMEFAAGPVGYGPARLATLMAAILLAGAGWSSLRSTSRWLLLSWIIVPLLAGMLIQIVVPFFYPRFLMFVTPAIAILMAQGLDRIRGTGAVRTQALRLTPALTLVLGLSVWFIAAQWQLPLPAPDLRPLAHEIETQMQSGDALVYSYSWQPGMLAAYLPDDRQPAYYASFFEAGSTGSALQEILDEHHRVWLVTYTIGAEDPINDVGLWLLENAATPGSAWYSDSQLSLFLNPDQAANAGALDQCATMRDSVIRLCFAPLEAQSVGGTPVAIALQWEITQPLAERYVVFVHLLAPGNPVPAAQHDSQPVNGLSPTFSWKPGSAVTDLHALVMPPVDKALTYDVVVGLYDADTLARVAFDDGGDSIRIGQITIQPSTR